MPNSPPYTKKYKVGLTLVYTEGVARGWNFPTFFYFFESTPYISTIFLKLRCGKSYLNRICFLKYSYITLKYFIKLVGQGWEDIGD